MITHRQRHRGRARRVDLLHARAVHQEPAEELLVAIEATGDERGVLSIGELLSRRDRINAHLIGVDNLPPHAAALTPQDRTDIRAAEQNRLQSRTRQLLHHTVGRGAFWTTDVALGELVTVISDEARKGYTRLILLALPDVGEKRRGTADALVAIANAVDVPILAVPRHQELLPTRVLVATDFSSASTRAARIALSVLGPRGHMSLLHVEPEIDYDALGHPDWRCKSAEGITLLFEELRRELDEEAHVARSPHRRRTSTVKETILLPGEPASVILEHAAKHRNDLIVVGTRRVPNGEKMPFGSVSMAVLRGAKSAVLIAQAPVLRQVARLTDPFFKAHHTAT